MENSGDAEETEDRERWAASMRAAEERGLLGPLECELTGRFSVRLINEARRASGLTETNDLLTYALIKLVLEDDFGERLLTRTGRIPKGTMAG